MQMRYIFVYVGVMWGSLPHTILVRETEWVRVQELQEASWDEEGTHSISRTGRRDL